MVPAGIIRFLSRFAAVSGSALALVLLFLLTTGSPGGVQADNPYKAPGTSDFEPAVDVKFCNTLPATFPQPYGGTDAQLAGDELCAQPVIGVNTPFTTSTSFVIPQGNINFSSFVSFVPPGVTINAVPVGQKVGGLRSTATLSLVNSPCTNVVTVNFVLFNVALPNHPTNPTNIAWPKEEGQSGRHNSWVVGGMTRPAAFGTNPGAFTAITETAAASGIAAGSNIAIQNFPSHLIRALSPSFANGTNVLADDAGYTLPSDFIMPKAVYGGLTKVLGTPDFTPLYFIQLDAGKLADFIPTHPWSQFTADSGQPNVVILTDPTSVKGSPSSITDFCTLLDSRTVLLGTTPGGNIRTTAPATSGTRFFRTYSQSFRDFSNDGIENQLSMCPKQAVPFATRTGPQADWIAACTSLAGQAVANTDWDTDLFLNRQDNCPVNANTTQVESEMTQTWAAAAPDWGPKTDGMGDGCDAGAAVAVTQRGMTFNITPSNTVANGHFHAKGINSPKCFGTTEQTSGATKGMCTGGTNPAPSGGWPNSGIPHQAVAQDRWDPWTEAWIGTDAAKSCSEYTGSANGDPAAQHHAWPPDFNNDRIVDTQDVLLVGAPVFFKQFGHVDYKQRYDIVPDGIIDTQDVLMMGAPLFFKTCTPSQQ